MQEPTVGRCLLWIWGYRQYFDPDIVGLVFHPIVYSYVDSNGCGDSDTAFYNVTAPPVVSISDIGGICEGSSSFMLTNGTPSGGSYSGMAVVSGTSMFDPSLATVGSNVVVYTYSDGVCTAMDTGNVEVVPLPVVALDTFPDVCVGAGTLALSGGQPGGGVYSGPGVSGNSFDPSITGPGVFTLTYTYTDSLGCSASVSESINVVEDSVSIQITLQNIVLRIQLWSWWARPLEASLLAREFRMGSLMPQWPV